MIADGHGTQDDSKQDLNEPRRRTPFATSLRENPTIPHTVFRSKTLRRLRILSVDESGRVSHIARRQDGIGPRRVPSYLSNLQQFTSLRGLAARPNRLDVVFALAATIITRQIPPESVRCPNSYFNAIFSSPPEILPDYIIMSSWRLA